MSTIQNFFLIQISRSFKKGANDNSISYLDQSFRFSGLWLILAWYLRRSGHNVVGNRERTNIFFLNFWTVWGHFVWDHGYLSCSTISFSYISALNPCFVVTWKVTFVLSCKLRKKETFFTKSWISGGCLAQTNHPITVSLYGYSGNPIAISLS